MEPNTDAQADARVVPAQLICFVGSLVAAFGTFFYSSAFFDVAVKVTDALFICGCMLLAVKYARDKIDLAAAGYTIVAISWGFVGASIDFKDDMEMTGMGMFTSAIYFLVPGMILISFNTTFPWWLRGFTILGPIPLAVFVMQMHNAGDSFQWNMWGWGTWGLGIIHWVSLAWAIFIYRQWRHTKQALHPGSPGK